MKERQFVSNVTRMTIPNTGAPYGRIERFVIDVDMNAVREYVMTGQGAEPWPDAVFGEILDSLYKMAQGVQFLETYKAGGRA